MRPTLFTLERFVAPKLSQLSACNAPQLDPIGPNLAMIMMEALFGHLPAKSDAQLVGIVYIWRTANTGTLSYVKGREAIHEFVQKEEKSQNISLYYNAIMHYELCISNAVFSMNTAVRHFHFMGISLPGSKVERGKVVYEDSFGLEKMRLVYNRIKHFDEDVDRALLKGTSPPVAPIWFSNDAVESDKAAVTFEEIASILRKLHQIIDLLVKTVPAGIRERIDRSNETL